MKPTATDTPASSTPGRLWIASLGLCLAVAGGVFTWVLWVAWQRAEETRRWPQVPCRVVVSRVARTQPTPNSNPAYSPEVRYRYTYQGMEHTGTRLKRVDSPSQHEEVVRQKIAPWKAGDESVCHVNPAMPQMAVLKHDTRAALYSIWFPLLFVFGGLRITWGALFHTGAGAKKKGG